MKRTLITGALLASALSMSTMAMAQGGVAGGAVGGAIVGGAVGGPVGAAVGAAAGATAGGIAEDARPRFHSYVVERKHPSYRYQNEVRIGAELPDSGVTYYEVPGNTGRPNTVTRSSTIEPCWSIPERTGSFRSSSKQTLQKAARPGGFLANSLECESVPIIRYVCLVGPLLLGMLFLLSDPDKSANIPAPDRWTSLNSLRAMAHLGEPVQGHAGSARFVRT